MYDLDSLKGLHLNSEKLTFSYKKNPTLSVYTEKGIYKRKNDRVIFASQNFYSDLLKDFKIIKDQTLVNFSGRNFKDLSVPLKSPIYVFSSHYVNGENICASVPYSSRIIKFFIILAGTISQRDEQEIKHPPPPTRHHLLLF